MKNVSVIFKIAMGFAIIFVIIMINYFITLKNETQLKSDADQVEHTHEVLENIELILSGLLNAETGQRGFLITGTEDYLEPFNNASAVIEDDLNDLTELTNDNPSQQQKILAIRKLTQDKFLELRQTIELRKNVGFEEAQAVVISGTGKSIMDEIRVILKEMEAEENKLLQMRRSTSIDDLEMSKQFVFWITIFGIAAIIILIVFYGKIIASPIRKLSKVAEEISRGNLKSEISPIDKKDEIGVLSNAFILMQENLREKADQAKSIAEGNLNVEVEPLSQDDTLGIAFSSMVTNLRNQMNEIKSGINVLSASSSELMTTVSQLAANSAETATSVSEATSTIAEIKQTTQVSNDKAIELVESGKKVASISQEGNKSILRTIEGMNKIKQQMESIATIVIQLSEKSNVIGEIATTVNDLSEQSNLLAVNASIEAVKAGEQGKGFSVVAQEIKNLAHRSKESTIQIRSILSDIQKDISGAVMATEEGGKVIDEGLGLSSRANEVIVSLADNSSEALEANILFAASSQQQQIGMDQISVAMENIKEASSQNSESTQANKNSIEELKLLGDKLFGLLSQYKID